MAFVLASTAAAVSFREWATVPFHFIWIGLTLLYGWRVWRIRATLLTLGAVILLTGFALLDDVFHGTQPAEELTEIPLMAVVFLVMVWYVRRHVAAREQARLVSERNLALLNQQRRLIQDASHVLRTPLTIAMGHAELMLRAATEPAATHDLRIIVGELHRLKTISDRLLALAAIEQPDFLHTFETPIGDLVTQVWSRWSSTSPRVRLGAVLDESVRLDPAHVADALDELISNALVHTPASAAVTVSVSREDGWVALTVADEGQGIPEAEQDRIFERFARADATNGHKGLGLGLALVKAIAEAHGGFVALRRAPGHGSIFELRLPAPVTSTPTSGTGPAPCAGAEPSLLTPGAIW